ncbi:CPBP family intramembrane glutamic endopeptidase [Roseovarius sp. 2305UL8-3]|uniref:CPBP family intramembrane glutamic endopeptidase n=1 Tax=Roseovarius conchicola TaxID=3121636 RepID=UPI0035280580
MSYRPHEQLVAPARSTNELIRLIIGAIAVVVVFVLLGMVYAGLERALLPPDISNQLRQDLITSTTAVSTLVNLFFFGLMTVSLAIVLRMIHSRSLISLIGYPPLALWQFWLVTRALVGLYIAIYILTAFLPAPESLQTSINMAFGKWLLFLPLTLLGLLIQTSAEELVFRGYLQSQLAARFSHPLVWIVVPSLLFALLHFDPEVMGNSAWLIVVWAGCFGMAAADLTARSGTLGPAIALHLTNNTIAIALTAPDGNFDGLALYTYPFSMTDADILMAWMPVEMLVLLCTWLVARLTLRC